MKFSYIFVLIIILGGSIKLKAQEFNLGLNINTMPFKVLAVTNTGSQEFPNYDVEEISSIIFNIQANAGFDYLPLRFKDGKIAIGLNSNIALGYLFNPSYEGINGALTIEIPQYIALRYGKRAVKDNTEVFGLGLGLGYNYQFIPFPDGVPAMFIDYSFKESWFIKISLDLKKRYLYNYYSSEGYVPDFEYRQIGIQIGYTL